MFKFRQQYLWLFRYFNTNCTVNPIPIAQFNAIQLDTCVLPASYSLVNNSIIINSWSLGDGSNTNSNNLNYSYVNQVIMTLLLQL